MICTQMIAFDRQHVAFNEQREAGDGIRLRSTQKI